MDSSNIPTTAGQDTAGPAPARVGTVVWGLIVLALAALIIVAQLGIVTLNGTYVLIAIFFNVLWHHAVDCALLDSATLDSAHSISRQYAVGPIAYLMCFGLSWVSVPASLGLNIALAVFFAIPARARSK